MAPTANGVLLPDYRENLAEHVPFCGIGFGNRGVPLDVLAIYLLKAYAPRFTALIVDEFARLNGSNGYLVEQGKQNLIDCFATLDQAYTLKQDILFCSTFMDTPAYLACFEECQTRIAERGLEAMVESTVPESRHEQENAALYAVHEFACVLYMQRQGFDLKIGPSREQEYDRAMHAMDLPMQFAYLLDAYPLGSSRPTPVVHYVPTHYGKDGTGCRIYFSDDEPTVRAKLMQASPEATRYFFRLASVSSFIQSGTILNDDEFFQHNSKRQRRILGDIVCESIMRPYQQVVQDDK